VSDSGVDAWAAEVVPWIGALPTAELRAQALAARTAGRRRRAEADAEAVAARAELDARRAADWWRMWCAQVSGGLADHADVRADPTTPPTCPAGFWLSRLDAEQFPDRIGAWLGGDARTLVLYGSTGRGKSHAAVAAGYAAAAAGVHVRFTSQLDYLQALRPGGVDDPAGFRRRHTEAGLLILDDLGAECEDASQFVRQEVCALLDARLRAGRRQIVTTNLEAPALAGTFGDRIVSRLRDRAVVLKIRGGDRRVLAAEPW
jgi:hypothetical protein